MGIFFVRKLSFPEKGDMGILETETLFSKKWGFRGPVLGRGESQHETTTATKLRPARESVNLHNFYVQGLRSRPPFTEVPRGPGLKGPHGVLFEQFWAPASEWPQVTGFLPLRLDIGQFSAKFWAIS